MTTGLQNSPMPAALANLTAALLEEVVGRAKGQLVTIKTWRVNLLGGLDSSPFAGGVYRLDGPAVTTTGRNTDWTIVLKIVRSPEGVTMPDGSTVSASAAEDQGSFAYWRREAICAQMDLGRRLPMNLRAPRFLGSTAINAGEHWLWFEYLPDHSRWTMTDYYQAAWFLGEWQSGSQRPVPAYPWLSRNWLASWTNGPLSRIFNHFEQVNGYKHPLLTSYFTPEELSACRELWANRQCTLSLLRRLPPTLCHFDAHRGNLAWCEDQLVLLDWAFVGYGARGEELAAFVGATLLLDHVPLEIAAELEEVALKGYLGGLRNGGWQGDEQVIKRVYRLTMALRYAPISLASMLRTATQPEIAISWEKKSGRPLSALLSHRAQLIRFFLSRLPHSQEFFKSERLPLESRFRQHVGR